MRSSSASLSSPTKTLTGWAKNHYTPKRITHFPLWALKNKRWGNLVSGGKTSVSISLESIESAQGGMNCDVLLSLVLGRETTVYTRRNNLMSLSHTLRTCLVPSWTLDSRLGMHNTHKIIQVSFQRASSSFYQYTIILLPQHESNHNAIATDLSIVVPNPTGSLRVIIDVFQQ